MKYWAQFYRFKGNGFTEVLGDRGVIRLDGRSNLATMHIVAADECRKRKFDGYRLMRGELLRPFYMDAEVKLPDSPN